MFNLNTYVVLNEKVTLSSIGKRKMMAFRLVADDIQSFMSRTALARL